MATLFIITRVKESDPCVIIPFSADGGRRDCANCQRVIRLQTIFPFIFDADAGRVLLDELVSFGSLTPS